MICMEGGPRVPSIYVPRAMRSGSPCCPSAFCKSFPLLIGLRRGSTELVPQYPGDKSTRRVLLIRASGLRPGNGHSSVSFQAVIDTAPEYSTRRGKVISIGGLLRAGKSNAVPTRSPCSPYHLNERRSLARDRSMSGCRVWKMKFSSAWRRFTQRGSISAVGRLITRCGMPQPCAIG